MIRTVNSDLMRQMFDLGYHATRHAVYAPPDPPRYPEDPHYMAGYRAGIKDRDQGMFAHIYPPVPPFHDHSGQFGAMTCDLCNADHGAEG